MKNLTIFILIVCRCYGGEVLLKDGRFVTLKVDRDNKGHVEKYQILLHDKESGSSVSIIKESAPDYGYPLVVRLRSLESEISDYFEDDKEVTLFVKRHSREAVLFSIDLEAEKISRPLRSVSFPGKRDVFSDDLGSWVLLDHDQLAFRSKGFAQRIFIANDDDVMEELLDADTEKQAKRQSVKRGESAGGGSNHTEQGTLKYHGPEGEGVKQHKMDARDRLPWIIAGGLLVGILFLLFKMLKGKFHSC